MDKDFVLKTLKAMYFETPNKEHLISKIKETIQEIELILKQSNNDVLTKKAFKDQLTFQKDLLKMAKKL